MSILIGADLIPTKSNEKYFIEGNLDYLFGKELVEKINEFDYKVFNLETPLTDCEKPIYKCGPNLIAPTETINAYNSLKVNLLVIGNNHILDQGDKGFISTMEVIHSKGMDFVGGGINREQAEKPYIKTINNKKIGFYACCEHEFSLATENKPGANPFDPFECYDTIASLKEKCDYIIVLYHGGKEHLRYPSPNLQKYCRKFIEKGANLVICQHSHCIGCEEKYMDGIIIYGQGNVLFDRFQNECWNTGLLVAVSDDFDISYIPLCKKGNGVRLANEIEKSEILNDFNKRSNEIMTKGNVERLYKDFSINYVENYLLALNGTNNNSFFNKVLYKITNGKWQKRRLKRIYKKDKLVNIINFIECEAHHELLLETLKNMIEDL